MKPFNINKKKWTIALCFSVLLVVALFIDWRSGMGIGPIRNLAADPAILAKVRNIPVRNTGTEVWGQYIDRISRFRDTMLQITYRHQGAEGTTPTNVSIFNQPISFSSDTIVTTMDGLYFRSGVSFAYSRFEQKNAHTSSVILKPYSSLLFYQCIAEERSNFINNSFGSAFEIAYCRFRKPVSFLSKDTLTTTVKFEGNFFGDGLYFNNLEKFAALSKEVQQVHIRDGRIGFQQIRGTVVIRGCELHGKLDLSGCGTIGSGKLIFEENTLPDTLDLSKFSGSELDLRGFRPDSAGNRICYLNLLENRIGKLNMEYHNYRLYFPAGTTDDQVSSTYQWLMKSEKENGYDSSYEQLDMEYRHTLALRHPLDSNAGVFRFLRQHISKALAFNIWSLAEGTRPSHFWDTIQRLWWGYGYRKTRVLFWSVLIILIFSFFNIFHYERLLKVLNVENLNPENIPATITSTKRKVLWYWYCLIYSSFLFFKVNFEFKSIDFKNKYVVALLVQYLIGLVCSAFIVNLILG
ncbi:hypothetical protein A0256_15365 [Mucilaginibacter sp. PAMC 26640]|nr:hypothetical protein A0256_15365 [Mucilaginibacter sp. PAMC 26640]